MWRHVAMGLILVIFALATVVTLLALGTLPSAREAQRVPYPHWNRVERDWTLGHESAVSNRGRQSFVFWSPSQKKLFASHLSTPLMERTFDTWPVLAWDDSGTWLLVGQTGEAALFHLEPSERQWRLSWAQPWHLTHATFDPRSHLIVVQGDRVRGVELSGETTWEYGLDAPVTALVSEGCVCVVAQKSQLTVLDVASGQLLSEWSAPFDVYVMTMDFSALRLAVSDGMTSGQVVLYTRTLKHAFDPWAELRRPVPEWGYALALNERYLAASSALDLVVYALNEAPETPQTTHDQVTNVWLDAQDRMTILKKDMGWSHHQSPNAHQ